VEDLLRGPAELWHPALDPDELNLRRDTEAASGIRMDGRKIRLSYVAVR
jgi:hypothetical protein